MADTVSVVIAVYNGERYLGECLESVLGQTVPPDEIIVVDDGSTDGSSDIAQSFGSRVTVLRQDNAGQAAAIATGISRATGTHLSFNDADDLWTPRKQEWQLAALSRDPEIDVVFGHAEQFVSPEIEPVEQKRLQPRVAIMPGQLLQAGTIHRRAFERIGGIDPSLRGAGFTDWIGRSNSAGLIQSMLPEVVLRRRLHSDNYGRTQAEERDRNLLSVLRRQIQRNRR